MRLLEQPFHALEARRERVDDLKMNQTQKPKVAIFSSATGVLLWLDEAVDMRSALRSLNGERPFSEVETDDPEDFLWACSVSEEEAAKLERWLDSDSGARPELGGEDIQVFSQAEAIRAVQF